jgi:Glyoxalase-like domain
MARVMAKPCIDHLVVAANSLAEGTDYISETLGVKPEGGGEHVAMGTHNRVVRLGEGCYLEVIAINPSAPKPLHPRWFELDTDESRRAILASDINRERPTSGKRAHSVLDPVG